MKYRRFRKWSRWQGWLDSGGPRSTRNALIAVGTVVVVLWILFLPPQDAVQRMIHSSSGKVWAILIEPAWNPAWLGLNREWVARREGGMVHSWRFAYSSSVGECVVTRAEVRRHYAVSEVITWIGEHGRHTQIRNWDFELQNEGEETRVTVCVTGGRGLWDLLSRWFRGSQSKWTADRLEQAVSAARTSGTGYPR